MTQQLVLKEAGFYYQDSNLVGEGTESTPAQSPPLSQDPALPLLPEGYKRFPIPSSVFSLAAQTVLHPLWKVHLWVSESPSSLSSCLRQDLGYVVLSLHVVVGETCAMLHWITVESKNARIPREWLLRRPSEKQKSAVQHSQSQFSSKHLPQICAW